MKFYKGTKIIKAESMKLGDYLKEYPKKVNEDLSERDYEQEGYKVGYPDMDSKFNGEFEEGCRYISWCPKDIFESTYKLFE